ncbi:MAG: hypothetical protein HRT66_07430 [Flavobacteriaceae bacterium]|nr:hypothetical protein [Flavobacteriaceae bacterium]
MFAEAKWQLDGTSYQLPFLLDLNKTRNSSLKIIDSDNDGKGFEVNIQVYPKTIVKFEGSIIELDGKASDKKIEPGLKPNNELTIKDNEDYIVHELILSNEKKVKFDINIIEDDLAKEDSNYKITFKSRDDKVFVSSFIQGDKPYITLDVSELSDGYVYITVCDQSDEMIGKLRIYRSGKCLSP